MGGSACLGTWGTLVEVEALKSLMTKLQVIPVRFTCLFFSEKSGHFGNWEPFLLPLGLAMFPRSEQYSPPTSPQSVIWRWNG